MKTRVRVQVEQVKMAEVELEIEVEEGDEPTDLTDEERLRALELANDSPEMDHEIRILNVEVIS